MKYELTEKKEVSGVFLYRIKALKDFGDVKRGDIGGWIEKEENLSQENFSWVSGDAWVYGNARASGDAWVFGTARVSGDAWVYGNARVSGNAFVCRNALVYGDARVSGNALVTKSVINLIGLSYTVTITDNYMQIGCENHPFEYWLALNKEDILKMDGKEGMKFAKIHKKYLKRLIKNRN